MAPSSEAFSDDQILEITRVFEAPRELVFKLWTNPEHVVRWYGPEGYFLSHCTLDARVGGGYRYCMARPDGYEHWISGTYREVSPPERLSFTYVNAYDGHEMLVELAFRDIGGRTEMSFRQAPFTSREERDGHRIGWNSTLDLFAAYAQRADLPGRKPAGEARSPTTSDVAALMTKMRTGA